MMPAPPAAGGPAPGAPPGAPGNGVLAESRWKLNDETSKRAQELLERRKQTGINDSAVDNLGEDLSSSSFIYFDDFFE